MNYLEELMRKWQEWQIEQRIKKEQEQWIREEIAKRWATGGPDDKNPGLTDGPNTLEQIMRLKHPHLLKGYKKGEADMRPGHFYGHPMMDWWKRPPDDYKGLM